MSRLVLLALPLLSACVASEPVSVSPVALRAEDAQIAQTHIREALRDPEGARFRNARQFATAGGDQIICGEYNATNGFGGYVGYTPYYVRLREGLVDVAHITGGMAAVGCRKAREGLVNVRA
ncbi:hypothetical protein [Jannaschia seohaensis]|uniref:Uncharacterized protein n=1 Tax=Jannaschia seohaensis TaxID=475081 RepID=A0A2Y9ATG2_9RHOB|nr:hypothetical protein [Jannaschia seohaensis]PWJ18103.1 hypothetical protein BCF38_10590 [Jannaschia seohaensis]SSA46628.1 hypothetical protein SAMN05421539_10590 [Jannaschia seohaensis]